MASQAESQGFVEQGHTSAEPRGVFEARVVFPAAVPAPAHVLVAGGADDDDDGFAGVGRTVDIARTVGTAGGSRRVGVGTAGAATSLLAIPNSGGPA